jgi:hypothetical protein
VLLAWSIIGDPLIEVIGVLPLFLACVLKGGWIVWSRRVAEPGPGRAGTAPAGPGAAVRRGWAAAWYEWSLALAAAAAVPVAAAGNRLIRALGGYTMANPFYHLQSLYEMRHGLSVAVESVLVLFGADFKSVTGTGNVAFALVHLIGVAVVLAGFCFGAWGLVRPFVRLARSRRLGAAAAATPGDLIADFLVIAVAANCAAFVLEVPLQNAYSAHEIAPVLSLGAALAGRTLGSRIYGRRASAASAESGDTVHAARPARPGARRGLLAALAAGLACYAVLLGIAAAHRQGAPRNVALTAWLTRHHLTSGFAAYWEASSITVDSGGAITLLSVTDGGWHGRLVPQKWLTDTLLTRKMPTATFVIVSPGEKLRRSSAVATFGQPAQSYRYGPFTILVWQQNLVPQMLRAAKQPATRAVSVIGPGET